MHIFLFNDFSTQNSIQFLSALWLTSSEFSVSRLLSFEMKSLMHFEKLIYRKEWKISRKGEIEKSIVSWATFKIFHSHQLDFRRQSKNKEQKPFHSIEIRKILNSKSSRQEEMYEKCSREPFHENKVVGNERDYDLSYLALPVQWASRSVRKLL